MQYPTMQYATCIIPYTVYMISEMHCNTCQVSVFKSIHPDMLGEPGAFQEGIKLFTSNQRRPSWTSSVWIFISCISVSGGQKRKASFDSASSKRRNKFPGKNDHQVFQATFNTRRCFYFPARPISHGSKADWILSCGAHLLFLARPKWKAWSRTAGIISFRGHALIFWISRQEICGTEIFAALAALAIFYAFSHLPIAKLRGRTIFGIGFG